MVITNGVADAEMIELIERHDLLQVSQEGLLQQLWRTLQELFTSRRSWQGPVRHMGMSRTIFDSVRTPLALGFHSVPPGPTQKRLQSPGPTIALAPRAPYGT